MGTAYEYFAKRLLLAKWLKQIPHPKSVLVAGLPEVYGVSLDFLLFAEELGAEVTVVSERQSAIDRLEGALSAVQARNMLTSVQPNIRLIDNIVDINLDQKFDVIVCCEVLQRLSTAEKETYLTNLSKISNQIAIYTPNGDNAAHASHSGLDSVPFAEFNTLANNLNPQNFSSGYIDMPPFPPGITRTEDQRQHAESGLLETVAMHGLGFYAKMEKFFPTKIRRDNAHIVYGFLSL